MSGKAGIFPTFFLSGFECSTFDWKERGRRNLIEETHHHQHMREDYRLLRDLGIAVSREGVPWPLVDKGGDCDLSCLDEAVAAMNENGILPIWDLCHYGYPDDLDPLADDDRFVRRFADYARCVAQALTDKTPAPHFYTPVNEITFFSYCGGEWAWVAPWGRCREQREALRVKLCEAAIAGVKAIREIDPQARMVHMDPLVQVVAPRDRPDLEQAAREETDIDTFLAWDILAGKVHPELGGSMEVLDIVAPNNYSFGQMEYREHGPHAALPPDDDRIRPLCDLLQSVWERYRRPMIIGETSGMGHGREAWLKDVMEESLAAVDRGMDLHGICLFPAVDMPDWHNGKWLHNGLYDLVEEGGDLKRVAAQGYIDELRRWQKELNRVTRLDADPMSDPVELQDVIDAAHRRHPRPDRDWH